MSNYTEDQELEVEALEAIYPKEFAKLQDSPLQWKVHVVPFPDGEGENHVGVDMVCTIGPSYPDTPPDIDIVIKQGLNEAQAQELLALAQQNAQDNVGIAMGYTLAEAIREWLADNNQSATDGSMHANMLRRMDEKTKQAKQKGASGQGGDGTPEDDDAEALRKKRLAEGTPVTVENFAKWAAAFELETKREVEIVHDRPSGKQMFLQHLVKDESSDEGDEEIDFDLLQGEDEGLFLAEGGDDDEDLEGLSDLDDEDDG
ncbi:ubiquitin-conjugating enzyme/RWD-like protein [Tribonema minus]|uniref:Ubiquitin-conjugating enzyme/RWD-like protein n=1 Tax=Tribonema minus TaxID=303371 RepID=A0A835YPQ6_9STRA|nr:ubiquitin-conjugating enzyme/RWD-like protein [Tribonema minus]